MKNQELIGKKVYGFKFEDYVHNLLHYNLQMDNHIGEIGTINGHNGVNVKVEFKRGISFISWEYPAFLIEQNLVEMEHSENSYYEIY